MTELLEIERHRLLLQRRCELANTQRERNKLGQFATPPGLALQIMRFAASAFPPDEQVRFLDPALGTGSFYSALLQCFPRGRVGAAVGFEIDRQYAGSARRLWRHTGLEVRRGDFTQQQTPGPKDTFNLIVCNPPYVRHHHLAGREKKRLQLLTHASSGSSISGLTGLYGYFLLLAHAWASDNAICIWLIPSEFMDVNYGAALKEYLTTKVTLFRAHRFEAEDIQFEDALVSSSIVCFRNSPPPSNHEVLLTFGGSFGDPKARAKVTATDLRRAAKWRLGGLNRGATIDGPRLSDFFEIKRGLATGDNRFFILPEAKVRELRLPSRFLKPILPSPRVLESNEVGSNARGEPLVERKLFLLDCSLPEEHLRTDYPDLWRYLQSGKKDVASRYLCKSRSPWYSQENRPPAMFLCTYMGRKRRDSGSAFRFIFNHSSATAANVYLLMYPKSELLNALRVQPRLASKVWDWLCNLAPDLLLSEGRVYGGGLHKVEPRELANVPANGLQKLLGAPARSNPLQLKFFAERGGVHANHNEM